MKCLFKHHNQSNTLCLLALAMIPALATANAPKPIAPISKTVVQENYGHLPLSFEANSGQIDSQVKFLSRGHGYGLFLTSTEAVLSLQTPKDKNALVAKNGTAPKMDNTVVHMQWVGGNSTAAVIGQKEMQGKVNYLVGKDPAHWRTGVKTYAQVAYEGVYPGVDLVYYGNQGQLEYDVVVAPKVDPHIVRLAFRGEDRIKVNDKGELILGNGNHEIQMHKPVIYQEIAGIRKPITGGYILSAANEVSFDIGEYDHSRPLVIDPVLAYATLLGGNGDDFGTGIAVDNTGHAYVSGTTFSANFPTTKDAVQKVSDGIQNAFVAKLNPTGTDFDYITYFGGSDGYSDGTAIVIDSVGNAYVTGNTRSTNFPVTHGAVQTILNGISDAFVIKLNATGTAIDYATYLGGNAYDGGDSIGIDKAGQIYVAGSTYSDNFPTTANAIQIGLNGFVDAFAVKLDPSKTTLSYATYIGGAGDEYGMDIVINDTGYAYITGITRSTNFPVTEGAFQTVFNGGDSDAFVAKLNPAGSAFIYATYLGSKNEDTGYGISVDDTGHAYITGRTDSTSFPTTKGAFQISNSGGRTDGFVTKLNAKGTALDYSTYLGGNGEEGGVSITVDNSGHAYVTGQSTTTNFPSTPSGVIQPTTFLGYIFVTKLNSAGSALDYATFLDGGSRYAGTDIFVDTMNHIYVTGITGSANFPTTTGAFQRTLGGGAMDAFVAKLNIPSQPKNKDECKNNGWKTFNNPTFKNQGKCVSFVEHIKA